MGQHHASLMGSSFQYGGIIRPRQPNILHTNHIDFRIAPQQTSNDGTRSSATPSGSV